MSLKLLIDLSILDNLFILIEIYYETLKFFQNPVFYCQNIPKKIRFLTGPTQRQITMKNYITKIMKLLIIKI